jgi:predicted ATPase/DNA-binding SARP family transcriptional activator
MSSLTAHLFGSPRIELDGAALDLKHRKPLALLAYLLVTGVPHERESLAAFLWPDYPNARSYLRNNLSIIRRALGKNHHHWVSIDRHVVAWRDTDNSWVDVSEFGRLLAASRSHDHQGSDLCSLCVGGLSQAMDLARADFLDGFTLRDSPPFDEWSYFQSERLRADAAEALDALAGFHGRTDRLKTAIDYARRRLALDEYHEPAHRHLMEFYARSGQHALALHQYEVCKQTLSAELDVEPTQETRDLFEAIKRRHFSQEDSTRISQVSWPADRARHRIAMQQGKGVDLPPHNLPAPLTPLLGRQPELIEIHAMLADPKVRLVTLTGPGGVGKTRLGVAVAKEALPKYGDGVYFVSLAPLRSQDLVPPTIAQIIGIHVSPERPVADTLAIAIGERQILLVLDNFEHLLTAAPRVTELLQACPNLQILATSREVLNVTGEHAFDVPPLTVPLVDSAVSQEILVAGAAIQLFAQRAKQADQHFVLDEATTPLAAHICRRLDGLPLAIELAAARTGYLDLPTLAAQLNGYDDSFHEHGSALDLLTGAKRDVPERHRSLRRAIGWSYDLLSDEERALFRHLSVFVGEWSAEAAKAVCTEDIAFGVWEGLSILLDKHLIVRSQGGPSGPTFSMLETLREFALEQLRQANEEHVVRTRMAAYYVHEVEELDAKSLGRHFADVNEVVRQEFPNIQAVLDWALDQRDLETCLRLCAALQMFWDDASTEVNRVLQSTLRLAEGSRPSSLYASVLVSAGYYAATRGKYDEAQTRFTQGLKMNERLEEKMAPLFVSMAHGITATCLFHRGRYEDSVSQLWQGIAAVKETGDLFSLAMNETDLGHKLTLCGRFDEAAVLIEQALQRLRKTGQPFGIAKALIDQGDLYLSLGRYSAAKRVLEEGLALAENSEQEGLTAGAEKFLGLLALRQADYTRAAALLEDAIAIRYRQGNILHLIEAIEAIMKLAVCTGRPQDALRIAGAMTTHREARGLLIAPIARTESNETFDIARSQLAERAASQVWEEGAALSLDRAVALALEICRAV